MAEMSLLFAIEIKDLVKEHVELREKLENVLNQIEQTIGDMDNIDLNSQEEVKQKIDQLQSTIENLNKRLKSERQRTNKLQNELVNTKRRVFEAIEQGNEVLYKVIGFEKPIEKVNREVLALKRQIDQLKNNNESISARNETLEAELIANEKKISELLGLSKRLENEREDCKRKLSTLNSQLNQKLLTTLVNQITPRKLAIHLTKENASVNEDESENLYGIGLRLVGFLRNENLTSFHQEGEIIKISKEDLSIFELDDEFEEDCNYEIISPGIKLGIDVIIKPKIEKMKDKPDDTTTGSPESTD